jgi:hypothetical protein
MLRENRGVSRILRFANPVGPSPIVSRGAEVERLVGRRRSDERVWSVQILFADFRIELLTRRNFEGEAVFETAEAPRSFDLRTPRSSDDFSATPAETCAAVPKGRRHFLFFS